MSTTTMDNLTTQDVENPIPDKEDSKSIYVSKKLIAQGMFDVSLLSSNTNQLVHLINGQTKTAFPITSVSLLVISLILQVLVGGCLIAIAIMKKPSNPRQKRKVDSQREVVTKWLNIITTTFIFFITILNVVIPSFIPTTVFVIQTGIHAKDNILSTTVTNYT